MTEAREVTTSSTIGGGEGGGAGGGGGGATQQTGKRRRTADGDGNDVDDGGVGTAERKEKRYAARTEIEKRDALAYPEDAEEEVTYMKWMSAKVTPVLVAALVFGFGCRFAIGANTWRGRAGGDGCVGFFCCVGMT